jgi:hypothetical protein
MNTSTSDSGIKELPWIAAFAVGAVAWIVLGKLTTHREAWDDVLYLIVVMPVVTIYAGFAGWMSPRRAWPVAPALAAGQFAALAVQNPGGMNLWPFTVAIFAVLHIPALLVAWLGARLRQRAEMRRVQ